MTTDGIATEELHFAARDDGYRLAGTLIAPAAPRRALVLAGGTGFPREFFGPLARYLATRGHAVLTFDYRGIGGSAPQRLRGFTGDMSDWALRDMPGALDALVARHPGVPLAWIGHSFGGQVAAAVPGIERVDRIVHIAVSTGWWPYHRAPRKWGAATLWYLYGPLATRLFGCIPQGRIWQGRALPREVYRQWRRWCLDRRYFTTDIGPGLPLGDPDFTRLPAPIRAIAFTDDWIATPRTVSLLQALYSTRGVPVHTTWISPADVGVKRIDHEGAFHTSRSAVWPRIAEVLEADTG